MVGKNGPSDTLSTVAVARGRLRRCVLHPAAVEARTHALPLFLPTLLRPTAATITLRAVPRNVVAAARPARPEHRTRRLPFALALFFTFAETFRTLAVTLRTRSRKVAATHTSNTFQTLDLSLSLSALPPPRRSCPHRSTASLQCPWAEELSSRSARSPSA